MLILATTALAKIAAFRRDAIGRGIDDTQKLCAREALLDLGDFSLDFFAESDERDENDKIFVTGNPFAAEGDIGNRESEFDTNSGTH